jgi:hypothetical protein
VSEVLLPDVTVCVLLKAEPVPEDVVQVASTL